MIGLPTHKEIMIHSEQLVKDGYKTKKGKLCIVMDYCDDGDLQTKIKN